MRTILITYGCLSCLFSAGYGEENQPTVSDIPSCGILEAGKQTEIAALEQAAEQGDVQAQCRLVVIYARGEKIPKDERKAFAWASRAAQSGQSGGNASARQLLLSGNRDIPRHCPNEKMAFKISRKRASGSAIQSGNPV